MNENDKCQNMCCPYNTVKLFSEPVPPSCATGVLPDDCSDFTTIPTTSILVVELEELRAYEEDYDKLCDKMTECRKKNPLSKSLKELEILITRR